MTAESNRLSVEARRGLYETIFARRDMREFLPDPIPDQVLARVLVAAHHAASVGFTQPWDFIIVRDLERRREVKRVFEEERLRNAAQFTGKRREKFLSLKLEGIIESPLNLIVTCEPERFGPGVLGKTAIEEVEIYSTCLAVENLWLAARAEGLGVGWVSIVRNEALRLDLRHPQADRPGCIPVYRLCRIISVASGAGESRMGRAAVAAQAAPFRFLEPWPLGSATRCRGWSRIPKSGATSFQAARKSSKIP